MMGLTTVAVISALLAPGALALAPMNAPAFAHAVLLLRIRIAQDGDGITASADGVERHGGEAQIAE